MNPFSDPFTPDADAKRNGKIARLPRPFRDKTNDLLSQGQTAVQIAKWLNEIPQVKAMLAAHFGGTPISPQNLCEWKKGGYRDWLRHQQVIQRAGDLAADAGDLAQAADGLADSLFGLLTLDYTQTLMHRDDQSPEEFEKQRKNLGVLAQDIVRLRRCHLNARRVELQEQRFDQTQEKTGEQLFQLFLQWADNPAIQKAFLLGPAQRHGRLREHFGLPPKPQRDSNGRLVLPPKPPNHPNSQPSGQNQTKIKPDQTKKSASSRRSRGNEALTSSSSSSKNNSAAEAFLPNENVARPNSLSQRERDGVRENVSNSASTAPVAPVQTGIPQSKYGIPIPQITPGKTTQQLIAEIEDYAVEVALARQAESKSFSSSNPAGETLSPNENATPPNSLSQRERDGVRENASSSGEGELESSSNSKFKTQNSKIPLSAYDLALLEGKSHLEAMYAQFTPTPEELERRKRANEELRHPSGVPIYEPPAAHQVTTPTPQPTYGPCSSPYTWQGHRPLDPWKVHTS